MNWYLILPPGPRGLPALSIFKCRYRIYICYTYHIDCNWEFISWGHLIQWMVAKSCTIGGQNPIVSRGSTIQGGAGFRNHPE